MCLRSIKSKYLCYRHLHFVVMVELFQHVCFWCPLILTFWVHSCWNFIKCLDMSSFNDTNEPDLLASAAHKCTWRATLNWEFMMTQKQEWLSACTKLPSVKMVCPLFLLLEEICNGFLVLCSPKVLWMFLPDLPCTLLKLSQKWPYILLCSFFVVCLHWHNSVCVPNSVTYLNWNPILEGCAVRCTSKNGHQKASRV